MFQKSCWHDCFLMDYVLLYYLIYLDSIMQIKDGFGDGKVLVVSVIVLHEWGMLQDQDFKQNHIIVAYFRGHLFQKFSH